jgi:hypothetical protein
MLPMAAHGNDHQKQWKCPVFFGNVQKLGERCLVLRFISPQKTPAGVNKVYLVRASGAILSALSKTPASRHHFVVPSDRGGQPLDETSLTRPALFHAGFLDF